MSTKMMLYAEILRQMRGIKDVPAEEPEIDDDAAEPEDDSDNEMDDED